MNIERAKIAIDKMAFFIPEHILNDVYKDHEATAEVLAQDENRVVFSIVYHDKTDKRILSVTVKRHNIDVHYNGTMQVFSHRIDETFFNDVLNVLSDVQPAQGVEMENTMNQIIQVLNQCDVAYFDDISLGWYFDEEENTVTFNDHFGDELFIVFNEIQFTFENSELCFTLENGMNIQLDLYNLQRIN